MLYIPKEKRKTLLVSSFIGMLLFAFGDVLLQSFSNDGDALLIIMKTSVRNMPIVRRCFTLLTGAIAAPSMYFGLCAMESYLRDSLKNKKGKMYLSWAVSFKSSSGSSMTQTVQFQSI